MANTRIVQSDFRDYRRDRFVDARTSAGARLAPTLMLTNEQGVSGELGDELGRDDRARVEFDIPSAQVKSAELLFYVKGAGTGDMPLRLTVNGHRLDHHRKVERMMTGGWDRTRIAARHLEKGLNEIVFMNGTLFVDPGSGGRSSRSFDGGRTWHRNALGPDGRTRGEYLVRLRLEGFAPRGELVSPVFDLADPEGNGIAPRVAVRRLRLSHEKAAPRGR